MATLTARRILRTSIIEAPQHCPGGPVLIPVIPLDIGPPRWPVALSTHGARAARLQSLDVRAFSPRWLVHQDGEPLPERLLFVGQGLHSVADLRQRCGSLCLL
jgi:hypothetical protein